eukprot:UN05553
MNPPIKYDNGTIITTTSAMLTKGLRELQIHVPLQHCNINTTNYISNVKMLILLMNPNLAHIFGPPKEYDSTFTD